jgi:lipopolysaccharide/colanic/teichoic acid biosynthesis glycosyltransferase
VLLGDMSLVGPRPLRRFEVESLERWQLSRQDLRPGLTGLWQVLGRSDIDWDERIQLDYSYVSHWSLVSDLRILARTLPAVLRRNGAV